jgi:uncharacterized protein
MPKKFSEAQTDRLFYSSLVTEHIVPDVKDFSFRQWHHRLVDRVKGQPGFVRADLCPPLRCKDPVVKWYSILHFDSPQHLQDWVESPDRQDLVAAGQRVFSAYRFKSFTTGLEGWFSGELGGGERSSLAPPTWKQILAVVLGLYPVVMMQSKLVSAWGVFDDCLPEIAMLFNNLITSSILSLVVMPVVARRFRFWLQPAYQISSQKNDFIGAMMVATALIIMMIVFHYF